MAAEVVHKNQSHLAAIRNFFDKLVVRHTVVLNPALSVRGPRYSQREGKTPAFASPKQARELLESIDTSHVVGLRDRAVLGTFTFISVRANAVAKLKRKDYYSDGNQYWLPKPLLPASATVAVLPLIIVFIGG